MGVGSTHLGHHHFYRVPYSPPLATALLPVLPALQAAIVRIQVRYRIRLAGRLLVRKREEAKLMQEHLNDSARVIQRNWKNRRCVCPTPCQAWHGMASRASAHTKGLSRVTALAQTSRLKLAILSIALVRRLSAAAKEIQRVWRGYKGRRRFRFYWKLRHARFIAVRCGARRPCRPTCTVQRAHA